MDTIREDSEEGRGSGFKEYLYDGIVGGKKKMSSSELSINSDEEQTP
jgi:hypothetical protein